jgi:hypothetical protein
VTDSSAGIAGPFKKGADPRRNPSGAKSRDRAAWSIKFNNALAMKLDPAEAADILIKSFRARQSWATQEVLDRLLGKVTQPVETKQNVLYRVIYEKPKDKDTPDANG